MMTATDHRQAAAEHLAAADRALVGQRPDPQRAARLASHATAHFLAALAAPLTDTGHDVYAEVCYDDVDPARSIEAERDQLAAQVAELAARLDEVVGRTQCDRAALARARRLADGWAGDGRVPSDVITDLRAALDGHRDDDRAEASR